jgi:predicted alpha-1,2-mannosidase
MHHPLRCHFRRIPAVIALSTGLLLARAAASAATESGAAPYDAINPFIGTTAGGNTFPCATLPFGMMQWGPDTRADGWYHYEDHSIRGFSLTHISGAGCPIYADIPLLPWIGEPAGSDTPRACSLAFSHDHEQAHPGYYAVEFDNRIKAELTVAARSGIGRFVFPPGAVRTLLIKAGDSATGDDPSYATHVTFVKIRGADTVEGSVHGGGFCGSHSSYTLYFVFKFSRPFASFGTWTDTIRAGSDSASGPKAGAYASFPDTAEPILVKTGLSFVSVENAAANLASEIPGWDFDGIHGAATRKWNEALATVRADGGTPDERTIFYTGLYHMMLSPNLFSDSNGDYIGFDGVVRRLGSHEAQFSNFSDWDIYRDVIQLDSLLFPEQTGQMMQSLVRDAEQSGWLPRWPAANDVTYIMGGDSPSIVLAEAHAFGARGFDARTALKFMLKGALQPGTGLHGNSERPGLTDYLARGYLPVDSANEAAASMTVEYSCADFAISQFAAALGDNADAEKLLRSAQNWRTLIDSETGFIRPRTADGKFIGGWDPDHLMPRHTNWDKDDQLGFEEGSAWQYTFMIPHNYAGLIEALGGKEKVLPKLDKFFEQVSGWGLPTYTVTNEPDFCAPFVYLWAGCPWKTQAVIDRIRRETFTTKPDGLPGNDDLGATSGVYVWNALGMYPVIPGIGGLALGTPMFPRSVMRFGNGSTLEILAQGDGIYVQSVKLNGKPYTSTWLPIEALVHGANRLEFVMAIQPDKSRGTQPGDFPPSFDATKKP